MSNGKKKKYPLKTLSAILSVSLVISGLPIISISAAGSDPIPTAEELLGEGYMKPSDFDRDAVNAYADDIVSGVSGITDIGRLPSYEEFAEHTGYINTEITLTEFRNKYLTGSSFIVPQTTVTILITSPEELDLLSSLVNNTADGETSTEQHFYSTAGYLLTKDLEYNASRFVPIGTDTYRFNGIFDGDGSEVSGLRITGDTIDTYAGVGHFGLFGVIGAGGTVRNIGIVNAATKLPYTVGVDVGVLAGRNYGTIEDCYVNSSSVTVSNATVGGIVAENYGTVARTYAVYEADVSITSGSYSDPQPIAAVNNGTITYSYYINDGSEADFYGTVRTTDELINDGLPGTRFSKMIRETLSYYPYTKLIYPVLERVFDADSNGKYHIKTPSEFMYFIKRGKGENLILDNTIDMKYRPIDKLYTGIFSLDGTLTDESDLCSYIDIDSGTKCCGILNMSFDNSYLSSEASFSNVYFIGGQYNFHDTNLDYYFAEALDAPVENDTYKKIKFVYILGNSLENVHSSADMLLGYYYTTSYEVYLTLAKYAEDSSHSGRITASSTSNFSGIAYEADHCTSYAKTSVNSNGSNVIYTMGYNVKNSPINTDMRIETARRSSFTFASGGYLENCVAKNEYVIDLDYNYMVYFFGHKESRNCVFSGVWKQDCALNSENTIISIAGGPDGFVFDTDAVAEGYYYGCSKGRNVVFRGTLNTVGNSTVYGIGDSIDTCYNIGAINVKQSATYGGSPVVYGVGRNITNGVMAGKINFLKSGNEWNWSDGYEFNNIFFFGSGNGMNLVDVELEIPFGIVRVFTDTTAVCYNYGDVKIPSAKEYSDFRIGNNVSQCANFGNVEISGEDISFKAIAFISNAYKSYTDLVNSRNVNFGSISVTPKGTGVCSIYAVHVEFPELTHGGFNASDNYNLGDITIKAESDSDKVNAEVFGCFGGSSYGNITVSDMHGTSDNIVTGATSANYGDVEIQNVSGTSLKVFGVNYTPKYNSETDRNKAITAALVNQGNITVSECDVSGEINCYAFTGSLDRAYLSSGSSDISAVAKGNISIDNCTASDINVMAFGAVNQFSRNVGPITVKNLGKSILVSNVTVSDTIRIYGGSAAAYGEVNTPLYSTLEEIKVADFTAKNMVVCGTGNYISNSAYGGYVENNADITVSNGTVSNDLSVSGVGRTISYPAANKGKISISEITNPNGNVSGTYQICGVGNTTNTSVLNSGKITVSDLEAGSYPLYVNGIGMSSSVQNNALAINAGELEISGTMPELYVSGISYSANAETANGLFINAATINIDTASANPVYCGGIAVNATGKKLLNAINTGDIRINKGTSEQTCVYGVAYADEMQSVVNWGNITVNGLSDTQSSKVYAVGLAKRSLCAWLNYGDVTTNLSNPTKAYIGAVDFDGTVSDGNIIAGTGINYGSFNAARRSGKGSTSAWFVDLSGNMNVIPDSQWNYSTDPDADNVTPWCTDTELFKSQKSIKPIGYESSTEPYVFSYEEMLKPTFGFVYNNPLAIKYKNATEKEEYNGKNILDYAAKSELRGQTLAYLSSKYPDMAGGFCLNGSSIQNGDIAGHLDTDIEDCVSLSNIPFRMESIKSRWGNTTVRDFLENDLNQRDVGTTAKVNHNIRMESVYDYETTTGEAAKITNKTSLVPFQAPICGNLDTIVTIANLYVVTNEYRNIEGQKVKFRLDLQGSKNISFRYFNRPVIYSDQDDMIAKISEQFSDITYTGLDIPYRSGDDTYTNIPIPSSGQTTYALVGLAVSENGKKTNVLVVRLESAGTIPSGWLTSLRYATGVNSRETAYSYESMLTGSRASYTDTNIYNNTNKYTVTSETQVTESYGEITYPVYTMTKNMWHSTDGAFNPSSYFKNSISTTPDIYTSFAAKNVDNYVVYVNDGGSYTWYLTENMPSGNTTASDNGIETVKYFSDSSELRIGNSSSLNRLANGTVDTTASGDPTQTNSYNTGRYLYNPFKAQGVKTITVGTKTVSGELVILFKVIINKKASSENYIKDTTFGRRDNFSKTGSTVITEYVDILPTYFSNSFKNYYSKEDVSTLASMSEPLDNEFSDFVSAGNTYYPTTVTSSVNITAENGEVQKYSYVHKFNEIEMLPIDYIRGEGSSSPPVAYGTAPLVFLDEKVASSMFEAYFVVQYKENYGITLNSNNILLSKVEIYVDGVLDSVLEGNGVLYGNWKGLRFYLNSSNVNNLNVYMESGYSKTDLPDGIITIKPTVRLNRKGNYGSNNEVFTLELQSFELSKSYLKNHRIKSAAWNNTIVTSAISTTENELSNNVDIYGDGTIDYSLTPDEADKFYITNSVKPDCTSNVISIRMPPFAQLQEYNGTSWVTVYTAGADSVYQKNFTYSYSQLQSGYHYDFRVIAQAYKESDDELSKLVSYYYTTITATTRNKDISIEFDSGTETMQLYSEIIANNGNTAITINGKNGTETIMQQTKLYKGTSASDLESTYYKLAQGDYAIDVQVPQGYKYKIKIVGGSSEGYLIDHKSVKGKRILLPYANAQSIRLVVYIERDPDESSWGVTYYKSLFRATRSNEI